MTSRWVSPMPDASHAPLGRFGGTTHRSAETPATDSSSPIDQEREDIGAILQVVSIGEGGDYREASSGASETLILPKEETMVERRGAQIKGTVSHALPL